MNTHKLNYYFNMCKTVASGSKCQRRQVGSVIVKAGRVVSTGMNFHPRGSSGDDFCLRKHLQAEPDTSAWLGLCIHSEMNAMLFASAEEMDGALIFITHPPCPLCTRLILQSGVERCYFLEGDIHWSEFSKKIVRRLDKGVRFHAYRDYEGIGGGYTEFPILYDVATQSWEQSLGKTT